MLLRVCTIFMELMIRVLKVGMVGLLQTDDACDECDGVEV